jgi:hypothetical protein
MDAAVRGTPEIAVHDRSVAVSDGAVVDVLRPVAGG